MHPRRHWIIATLIGSGAVIDPDRRIAAGIVIRGYPIALIVTTLLGLPVFLVARNKTRVRWWIAPLLGIPIGILIVTPVAMSVSPKSDAYQMWANTAALGSLSSFVFWLIWRTLTKTSVPDGARLSSHETERVAAFKADVCPQGSMAGRAEPK